MSKRQRPRPAEPVADDDAELFRQAVGAVRPVTGDGRSAERPAPPAPEPRQFQLDEARVASDMLEQPLDPLSIEIGDELLFLRDGHDPRLLRRLRGGQFAVQDEIDLHQLTRAAARTVAREFLAAAVAQGRHCVRIIHGKGLRSPAGPVIKAMVDGLLRQHGDVLAFASARARDGGTGAVLVLLRSRRPGR